MTDYVRPVVYQDAPMRRVQEVVDRLLGSDPKVVLDAGCGYALPIDFGRSVHLVGLDASAEALAKNTNIDESLVGDLESYPLPSEAYDAVLCWTVLEHLSKPERALANIARSLKPRGFVIVGIPNIWSLKGLITKATPHWFHVWTYRHLLGMQNAGEPGFGPYRTHLRRGIAPTRLRTFARELGLERVFSIDYEPTMDMPTAVRRAWMLACTIGRVATLGMWDPAVSEHVAIFTKSRA